MHRLGRVERGEGDQRHPRDIAGKHCDLHAELRRERRRVPSSQYDGSGERRSCAGHRLVRIVERHDGSVQTFDQPLLCRYGVVRGRLGPVDMELRRFQRRYQRELLCIGLCSRRRRIYTAIGRRIYTADGRRIYTADRRRIYTADRRRIYAANNANAC
jgi:hypothetical protein